MDLVTVFKTINPAEADLVCAQLEAAGFEASVVNENANLALAPGTAGGIRVQVPDSQAADARALLASTIGAPSEASAEQK